MFRIQDPGPFKPWIQDGKLGSGTNVPDPQHCLFVNRKKKHFKYR
jgi:hypothetical protein